MKKPRPTDSTCCCAFTTSAWVLRDATIPATRAPNIGASPSSMATPVVTSTDVNSQASGLRRAMKLKRAQASPSGVRTGPNPQAATASSSRLAAMCQITNAGSAGPMPSQVSTDASPPALACTMPRAIDSAT